MSSTDGSHLAGKPKRRQNRSCDQCRTGKRRCDVQPDTRDLSTFSACSNCKKWKKECTIEWLKSREDRRQRTHQDGQSRLSPADQDEGVFLSIPPSNPWMGKGPPSQASDSSFGVDVSGVPPSVSTASRQPSWTASTGSMRNASTHLPPKPFPVQHNVGMPYQWPFAGTASQVMELDEISGYPNISPVPSALFSDGNMPQRSKPRDSFSVASESYLADDDRNEAQSVTSSRDWHFPGVVRDATKVGQKRRRADTVEELDSTTELTSNTDLTFETPSWSFAKGFVRPQSPFASHFLSEDFNRVQVKSGLLKVYHDSFEGALSCWLTERNCPYSISSFRDQNVWSRSWANRIFARTAALDDTYAAAGVLSARDQRQASKVLNAVVMAFAAQWSRPERHKPAKQPGPFSPDQLFEEISEQNGNGNGNVPGPAPTANFGRNVQKTLWHKAKAALNEASENMSFKVIFAGIIFALTQRPVETVGINSSTESAEDKLSALFNLLDIDGPTLSLDAALRKLHDHRRHLRQAKFVAHAARKAPTHLSTEEQETFNLLYWMAVMFDSLSAVMNKRSFTIDDAETRISRENLQPVQPPSHVFSDSQDEMAAQLMDDTNLWGSFFMREQSHIGDLRKQSTRWPCSYIDAAACLADAAPVKVLLYRRVGHLQGLFYQEANPEEVERGLESVLEVYNHWSASYGLFISDCIKHHETLPVRIQSWYTLLAAHWNLAVLIFADLIETLTHAGMTMSCNTELRQSMNLSASIRQHAVVEISDLGFHARHTSEPTAFAQSPDFHHAVNEAALLTEPWTVVLIRAFGFAGAILAKRVKAEGSKGEICVEVPSESRRRLQWCVDALALLGRKSDMAMCAADVLRKATS
ncbi:Regulatory protein alcR [Cercospora beticola]|uniref:Regulatory protein alcR n=2 Tax=Cercospora beticola TaxID=122368 RepID=A0A2G5I0Q5_CERBT|nr:Regulatory protein alcR [Cercospora beticola]PIA98348.1 Regulatory protein alcR [Cercospora beticola]